MSSFDGTSSFKIGHANEYLRCSNQFGSIVTEFKSRSTKNNLFRIEDIISKISLYTEYEANLYESFQRFQDVKIDKSLIKDCVDKLANVTDEEKLDRSLISTQKYNKICDINSAMYGECEELGFNAWGLFNGATMYTSNIMKSKGNDNFGNMFGTKGKINQTAYNFCLELS